MKFYGGSTAFYGAAQTASFFAGSAASTLIPDTFPVSINGRPYEIDLSQPFYRQYRRQIAPLIRTQADTNKLPGEHSLDPNGLWRRSFEDWSLGAGQRYLDRDTSVPNGFYRSKGVDCLTNKWQVTLLPDTSLQRASTNTNLAVVAANGYVYVSDGQTLAYTNNLTGTVTWTAVTGTPAQTVSSICTDGYSVYACYGPGGLYQTVAGSASASQLVTSALTATAVCGYVNGRLMVASGQSLYNITSTTAAALPTALLTTNNPNTAWAGFAEGNTQLYAAANIGGKGYVYGTSVTADGVALSAPTIQAALPGGESVASVLGYLGQIIIGTSLGVRYTQPSATGGLSLGALIPTTAGGVTYTPTTACQPVRCLAGYGRWVWYGWTNFDSLSSGLGRLDLQNMVTAGVLPASASDRMAAAQGNVTGVAVAAGTAVFAVAGSGIYVDSPNLTASGSITSGYILYDLADIKIGSLVDVETPGPLGYGSYSMGIATDGGIVSTVGTHLPGQTEPVTFALPGSVGVRFETVLTLNRDNLVLSAGPTVTRWTLRVYAAPRRPVTWQLPIVLDERIVSNSMTSYGFDPLVELQALEQMAASGSQVVYQESNQSYPVYVQDVQFIPNELTVDKHYYNGLCLVTLQGLPVPN